MIEWLQLSDEDKRAVLNAVGAATQLPVNAIEKDWWVTLALKACFHSLYKDNLVFKGGTSLSKAWGLIERFSEDIDLVLDRDVLGYSGELSISKIKRLRKTTAAFIAGPFRDILHQTLIDMGVDSFLFDLHVKEGGASDRDPQILELHYKSVASQANVYLADKVIIEIGCRSLMEPSSQRLIQSIIGETFPNRPFSGTPFTILTVDPQRTILEKMFLLHEEFKKDIKNVRHERMSRHLYDLHRLMDTQYGELAVSDPNMYKYIIDHRKKYTAIRDLDYADHSPQKINFIPPADVNSLWERDYAQMQESMIYGESPNYTALIGRIEELLKRVRSLRV